MALEARLLDSDRLLLERTGILAAYRSAPSLVHEAIEFFYLLVYAVVPLGATVLALAHGNTALQDYWPIVFLSELLCYAALPWLQSRPPRVLEPPGHPQGAIRVVNLLLLDRGSIQVNTLPSAHAAGAVAVGLALCSMMPVVGAVFLAVAGGITLATVLGRYHYAVDSAIGVGVAIASWLVLKP